MSIQKQKVLAALSTINQDIAEQLLKDYQAIKQQFFLRHFKPSELDGGRFAESVLRLLEVRLGRQYTPYSRSPDSENVINACQNNTQLHESERFHIPRICRVLLDIRNKRNVAHPKGDIDPNFSDSLLIVQQSDWMLAEIIRLYYTCTMDEARKIVAEINQVKIPIVADMNGELRVQDAKMEASNKALLILYYKAPERVKDTELARSVKYANMTRFRNSVMAELDKKCLVHKSGDDYELMPLGRAYVEKNLPLELVI